VYDKLLNPRQPCFSGKGVMLNEGGSQNSECEEEKRKRYESRLRRYPHILTDINQLQCWLPLSRS